MDSSSDLAAEIWSWPSSQVLRWCASLNTDTAPTDANWWLNVRWSAQGRLYDESLPISERRDGAAAALQLTRCMERFTTYGRWNAVVDEVNLRCYAIRHLGGLPGDDTCDLNDLLRTVTAALTLDRDEARVLASQWRELPREQILLLRGHKNLLAPLRLVGDQLPDGPEADQVRAWLAIAPHLP